ncbi:MAG: hypothetical protein JW822_06905 [Spirochaetales bacterium]|nr:hypothetical protein [Spirochaetales bacterium]
MKNLFKQLIVLFISITAYSCLTTPGNTDEPIKETKQLILIINYPYQIWSNDPTKIHVTLFKPDFSPAAGAHVEVNEKTVGTTDSNGVCIFDYTPGSAQSHILKARLVERGIEYIINKNFSCNARTVSFKAERLYVYTDRGVYNPGQDILVRFIAWQLKREYSAIPQAKVQLLFQDLNGKIFSGEYVTANEYGIGSTRIRLPAHMPEGEYDLVVLFEQAREQTRLRVKQFVPPVINIKHNLVRYITPAQKTLEAKVTLSYFSGGSPGSSQLVFSIRNQQGKEIFTKEYSSAIPEFEIVLDQQELEKIKKSLEPETEIKIKLQARDSYGQTDELIWDMLYTEKPFFAVLEIDKDAYPAAESVQLLVKVVDLDGQPAKQIPLTMVITSLKISQEGKTDDQGVASFSFVMPETTVTAVIKSPIMKSNLGQRVIPFQPRKPMLSKVKETPKQAGTKTKISVSFDPEYIPVEKVVHVDLTDISGSLVTATTIPVKKHGSTYSAEGEISAPTWGTMLVNLYCCAVKKELSEKPYSPETVGFITEGQHVTFYPDRELEIIVENFKPSYAPGEKVNINITVKGGKGEKCLGVSLVDGAVLSLLDPFIKHPFRHFYNPQAKVIATGGAGVLTWPVVDRNWGYPWRDIAYTNWGWKDPGDFIRIPEDEHKNNGDGTPAPAEGGIGGGGDEDISAEQEQIAPTPTGTESLNGDTRKNGDDGAVETPKKIIIRTRFPETSLWEPLIITKQGKSKFTVDLPHEITSQKLSIIASDTEGYLGFIQKDINVTKALFVRSLFPETLIRGDRIIAQSLVRNLTDSVISCKVTLESSALKIENNTEQNLTLDPGENRLVEWEISAPQCGKGVYRIAVETSRFKDVEEKEFMVLPAGEPVTVTFKQDISDKEIFEKEFTLDKDSDYRAAILNVALPNVFPAFTAYYAFDTAPWYTPWTVSAVTVMNAALLEYAQKNNGSPEFRSALSARLKQTAAILSLNQLSNGAWGFYPVGYKQIADAASEKGHANVYYTVSCLRALCEIARSGIQVNSDVILKAARYLLSERDKDGLWSSQGAYFWEVYNQETDYALSAEIFETLMHAATLFPELKTVEPEVKSLKGIMIELLSEKLSEPMTMAAAIQGLLYMRDYYNDTALNPILEKSINYLITLKRKAYWEPHWYHAYGGMVELNARILTLLALYNPEGYKAYLREGITWLLSTREAWGGWHNEVGTAHAIRALLLSGVFAQERNSIITIKVNNREVAKINIDPDDPFLSAARLSYFEISPWLQNGANSVIVSYNGALTASVILEVKEWSDKIPESAHTVAMTRTAATSASVGQPVNVKLSLSSSAIIPFVRVEEGIPSNCEVDTKSLETLITESLITGYSLKQGKLYLVLSGLKRRTELNYTLLPVRSGKSRHSGTRIIDAVSDKLLAYTKASSFIVK